MPIRLLNQPDTTTAAPAPRSGGIRLLDENTDAPEATSGSSWPSAGSAILGGAALAGAALLAHNPKAPEAVSKALEYANAARQQSMLSGWALLKSLLGNIGAAGARSAETRSLTPLKEMLSMQTLQDAKTAFKVGGSTSEAAKGVTIPFLSTPGRVMGAFDEAAQKALVRSGMTSNEAAHAVFQTPLGENFGNLGKSFEDNPVASYLIPFRRTPFNQFAEGWKTMTGAERDLPVLAGYTGAGAAHGYATSDDKYPVSIPLAVAGAAKYGVPYALGATAGRLLAGKKDSGNTTSGLTPVSEFGLTQSMSQPGAPFGVKYSSRDGLEFDPESIAAVKALKQLVGR
jgi:hypothetical protein